MNEQLWCAYNWYRSAAISNSATLCNDRNRTNWIGNDKSSTCSYHRNASRSHQPPLKNSRQMNEHASLCPLNDYIDSGIEWKHTKFTKWKTPSIVSTMTLQNPTIWWTNRWGNHRACSIIGKSRMSHYLLQHVGQRRKMFLFFGFHSFCVVQLKMSKCE